MNNQFYQCILCNHNYQQLYNLKQHIIPHLENAINKRNSAELGEMINTLNNQGRHLDITNFQNYYQMINRLQMSNNINVQEYFNTHARTILVFLRAPDNGVITAPPPPPYGYAVNHHPGQPTPPPPPPPPIGQLNQLLQEGEDQQAPILVEEAAGAAAGNIEINFQDLYHMREQYLNQIQNYNNEYDLMNMAPQPPVLNNVYDNDQILQAAINEMAPQTFADQVPQQQQQEEQAIAFNAAPPTPAQPPQRMFVEQIHAPAAAVDAQASPVQQQQHVLVRSESRYGRFNQLPQQRPRFHPYNNQNILKKNRNVEYVSIDEVVEVTGPDGSISKTHRVIQKTIVKR